MLYSAAHKFWGIESCELGLADMKWQQGITKRRHPSIYSGSFYPWNHFSRARV